MELEFWVIDLLDDIKAAAEKGENYDLHIEASLVAEIAKTYKEITNIEIWLMSTIDNSIQPKQRRTYT